MSFFEDTKGQHYPVGAIERISPGAYRENGKRGPARVIMKSGAVEIYDTELERLERLNWPCVPASSKAYLLVFSFEPEMYEKDSAKPYEPLLERFPIYGWQVRPEGALEPLAYGFDRAFTNHNAVEDADGQVVTFDSQVYPDAAAWAESRMSMYNEASGAKPDLVPAQ